jgi:hypothetical protein
MKVEVIGVHRVEEAEGPCHLLELRVVGEGAFDTGAITQPDDTLPESDWQAAYDPRHLTLDGTVEHELDAPVIPVHGEARLALFFHYLDLQKPLQTSAGPVALPAPSPRPERLRFVRYEAP